MNKVIVCTTIQTPTEALQKFDTLKDWTLVVAGDLKTPKDFRLENGIYLSPEEQYQYHPQLSEAIGWNTHGRRNFALLWAKVLDARVIAIVDDDNIPYDHWGTNLLVGSSQEVRFYETEEDAFDPVGATNYPALWHRGFPIQLLGSRNYSNCSRKEIRVDIQADFWNGDPDVDAVCRIAYSPECRFEPSFFPLAGNKPAPFNSQNTFIHRDILKDYFIFPHLTPFGRLSDIWAAYHAQSLGHQVVFGAPSVYQNRNPHDVTQDLMDEMLGYREAARFVHAIRNKTYRMADFFPEKACRAYQIYQTCFEREPQHS